MNIELLGQYQICLTIICVGNIQACKNFHKLVVQIYDWT